MIGSPPPNLPDREYFDYRGETVSQLPANLLKRRNPFAQSSVSAVKDVFICRRKAFLKSVVGLREPTHPTAAAGTVMHLQVERWHKGGPKPTHPSLLAAIEAGIIPEPGPNVLSEEQFWVPTGISSPDSPDGQLWLKGFMDLIVRNGPKSITIPDMKTKGNINACTRYALTQEELLSDPQMGLYGHVFHSTEPDLHLEVGHIYLVRDETIPYARWVPAVLTKEVARRNYLKLLSGAEQMVADAQCGDWQAVPGNYAKCEKPFKCPFVPLCHGKVGDDVVDDGDWSKAFEEPSVPNPYVNDPVAITPPDAAPPGMSAGEAKAKEKKPSKKTNTNTPEENTVTDLTDFDAILNQALEKKPSILNQALEKKPASAPAATPAASAPALSATQQQMKQPLNFNAAVIDAAHSQPSAPKSTPLPAGTPGAGSEDLNALDALLNASQTPKGAPKPSVAQAQTPAKPPQAPAAAVSPPPPPQVAQATPPPPSQAPAASIQAEADRAAASMSAIAAAATANLSAEEKRVLETRFQDPAGTTQANTTVVAGPVENAQPAAKPIALLCIGCSTDGEVTYLVDLIAQADAAVVARHNKKGGATQIASMYQLDHGMWRGDFVSMLTTIVKAKAAKFGPLTIVGLGDSPAASSAAEVLASMASRRVWGHR